MFNSKQITESGSLVIRNLTWREMGEYTCRAANEFGSESAATFLYPLLVIVINKGHSPGELTDMFVISARIKQIRNDLRVKGGRKWNVWWFGIFVHKPLCPMLYACQL